MSCSQICNQGRACSCGESRWSVVLGCIVIGIVFAAILAMGITP